MAPECPMQCTRHSSVYIKDDLVRRGRATKSPGGLKGESVDRGL